MKRTLVLAMLAVAAAGCSSDSGDDVDPIVTITNNWADEADATHTFQFNSSDDGERAGTFVGSEQFDGADVYDLTGSWGNGYVVFTVERPVPVKYTASVHEDDQSRFVFDSSSGQLVLNRGG